MNHALLDMLACPECRTSVALITGNGTGDAPITQGTLRCSRCAREFPIVNGIPRMLPKSLADEAARQQRKTGSHFTLEFEDIHHDPDEERILEYYFYSRAGVDPKLYQEIGGDPYRTSVEADAYRPDDSFLRGKLVLDGGCGPGRFTHVASRSAARVVGLDLGNHIEYAARNCRDRANVDFVQGSVLAPPFKPGVFDYVFTFGVVHHTPDPRQAVLHLAELVKPSGALSVWVYPPEYWGPAIRRPITKAVHRVLSRLDPESGLAVCTHLLYPLGKLQMALAQRRWTKLLAAPLFLLPVPRHPKRNHMIATIYDYYCPPIIFTHTADEVRGWLEEARFTTLRTLPVPTSCFGERRAPADATS